MPFKPSNSGAIASAPDVALSNPLDQQAIAYHSASGTWRNTSVLVTAPPPSGDTTGATDTAVINQLLAGNASVLLQAGRYWINNSLQIAHSFSVLAGQGRATELVLADTFPYNTSAIRLANPNLDKVTIRDLAIHGRRFGSSGLPPVDYAEGQDGITLDNSGGTGIANTDTNHRIERVFIRELHGRGIVLLCSATAIEQRQTHLISVEVYQCFDTGVYIDGPTDNTIIDSTVGGSSKHGYYFIRTANNKIVASKAFYCGNFDHATYCNFYINGYRNVFSGCESQDAFGTGVWFGQADNSWEGLVDNCTRGNNAGSATAGIVVQSAALRTTIRAAMPNYEGLQKRDILLYAPATVILTAPPLSATHVTYIAGDNAAVAASAVTLNNVPHVPSGATSTRPATVGIIAGAQYFDTTLSKPIWFDGSAWRDAAGAVI